MRGRPISSTCPWVEECKVFSTTGLTKDPRMRFDQEALRVEITSASGIIRVKIVTTSPNYGGVRYWFVCPSCKRRCGRLYVPQSGPLGCRKCLALDYEWQYRKDWRWRLCREACCSSSAGEKRLSRIVANGMGLNSKLVRTQCEEQLAWARIHAAMHLPDIMEDVALAAMSRNESCQRCEGSGKFTGAMCLRCNGTGMVRALGDIHALRLVLAMNDLIR